MNLRVVLFAAACSVVSASAVSAQTATSVRITFANGHVSIAASNATVGEILQEWARVGGSRFINAERIPATERLTLSLENEPEARALQQLLRSTAGYAAGARTAAVGSTIGNVVIVPVSRAGSYAQVSRPSAPSTAIETPVVNARQPQPDDDGPVRRAVPPPAPQVTAQSASAGTTASASAPLGQASPLSGTQTQVVPGLGAVTSDRPGAIIQSPARPAGRPMLTPTQPRRPGGGG